MRSEGRLLSGETRVEQVSFQMFPKGCNRGTFSYLKGKRIPEN